MRVAIGADHAGFELKREIVRLLQSLGIDHQDFGTTSATSVDYPDYAERVARGVARGEFDRGILVCGTGIGMAMAANKIAGIRAAAIADLDLARLAREHNDINVLGLGGRVTSPDRAAEIVRIFLDTPFAGGRHQNRLNKIANLEPRSATATASPEGSGDRAGTP